MSKDFEEIALLILIVSLLLIIFAITIVVSIFRYKRKQQFHIQEKQQLQTQFSQTLLQSQLEIQEQTLQHISNELHDNIAQVASVIKMNLYTINLNDPQKASQKIEDTRELIKQLITDIRTLSVHFNGDRVAQIGLSKALETEVERINKTELFTATYEKTGDLSTINDNKVIILYRMVQETLNNMVKHSGAQHIKLKLFCDKDALTLIINDDGCGFDVEDKLKNGGGAGLHNLKKRATLINALLSIHSSAGQGTTITIKLPYETHQPLFTTIGVQNEVVL